MRITIRPVKKAPRKAAPTLSPSVAAIGDALMQLRPLHIKKLLAEGRALRMPSKRRSELSRAAASVGLKPLTRQIGDTADMVVFMLK